MNRKHSREKIFAAVGKHAMRLGLLLVACLLSYPAFAQNRVRRLTFTVRTGDDDLRGDNDNLNVKIKFRDGTSQLKLNLNRGQRWPDNTTQTFDIGLEQPVALSEISSIDLQKPEAYGDGADEWHMASLSVRATGDGIDKVILTHGYNNFNWFDWHLLMPVTLPVAGKANKLEFTFKTGGDDLNNNDPLDVTIHFHDGATQHMKDLNVGRTWDNNSTHVKTIALNQPVDPSDIVEIDLRAGYTNPVPFPTDNWDMESLSVRAIGEGVDKIIVRHGFNRFTGTHMHLSIPITAPQAGKANKLELIVQTGDDDLRGDNDDLNVIVHFRGGRTQTARNVNGGKPWKNNSMHVETITLDSAVDPSEIVGVELHTTFTGGMSGDNWNMNSVIVKAIGDGVNEVLFTSGFKRFTGDDKTLRLRRGM